MPGIWRPHPLYQLAEGWGQSVGKGPPDVTAGAGQPADQKHKGKRSKLLHLANVFIPLHFFLHFVTFNNNKLYCNRMVFLESYQQNEAERKENIAFQFMS